jgi:hypothetical protein
MFGLPAAAEDAADAGSNGEFRSLVARKGQIKATERAVLHSFVSSAVTASEH